MKPFPHCGACRAPGFAFIGALTLAIAACGPANEAPRFAAGSGEVREFAGTWDAVGSRRSIPLGAQRKGSIIDLHGTMSLSGEGRPGRGFRSDLIALVDSETGLVGRGVWTDERGDQVFSDVTGEGTKDNNHIAGTILGGTGRFAGVTGSYEFSWKFVIEADDGSIQGSAIGLKGRVLPAKPGSAGSPP